MSGAVKRGGAIGVPPMSAANAAVVRQLVAAARPLTAFDIRGRLLGDPARGAVSGGSTRLSNRLARLAERGWLMKLGERGPGVQWELTLAARRQVERDGLERMPISPQPDPAPQVPVQLYVGQVAAPRQVDKMHCAVWRPLVWQPARAGASDFKRCPSLKFGRVA